MSTKISTKETIKRGKGKNASKSVEPPQQLISKQIEAQKQQKKDLTSIIDQNPNSDKKKRQKTVTQDKSQSLKQQTEQPKAKKRDTKAQVKSQSANKKGQTKNFVDSQVKPQKIEKEIKQNKKLSDQKKQNGKDNKSEDIKQEDEKIKKMPISQKQKAQALEEIKKEESNKPTKPNLKRAKINGNQNIKKERDNSAENDKIVEDNLKETKVKERKAPIKKEEIINTSSRNRRSLSNAQKAIEQSEYEESSEEIMPKKRLIKRGVPQNAKPQMPKGNTKKKQNIPEEYLVYVQNKDEIQMPEIDQIKEDLLGTLLNEDCCVNCTNKNVHRACMTQNYNLLMACINSSKKVSSLLTTWSPEMKWTPIEWAFYHNDMQMLDILLDYDKNKKKSNRVSAEQCLFQEFDTGMVSQATYGIEIRKVNISRGNRAGNNAFLEESKIDEQSFRHYLQNEYFIERLLRMDNLSVDHIQKLMRIDKQMHAFVISNFIPKLLIYGKKEISAQLIKPLIDDPIYQVNKLLHASLIAEKIQDLPDNYNKLSVTKACHFGNITALHTAALNPNLEILKRLLNMINSNVNQKFTTDAQGNQCIHYAAACEGTGPLELLIARDFNINYANTNKETPLFIAVKTNKPQNIKVIVSEDDEAIYYKDSKGYYAIHHAARYSSIECIKALCKGDRKYVDVVGGYNKMTPLMYAVAYGHYETVEYLIKNLRANINLEDKFKRNALTYAVRNGHLKITALLLQNMAFYNYPDNSKNFPLHYACAYGWYDCVKLLLIAGAQINSLNEWGNTPIMIAMLKNHKKIVKELLDIEGVDVNGTDDSGRNLLCFAMMQVNQESLKYIKFLIEQKGANINQEDANGKTPILYLIEARLQSENASITIKDLTSDSYTQRKRQEQEEFYQLFDYLLNDAKCNIDITTKAKETIVSHIFQYGKLFLLPLLVDHIDINKTPEVLFTFPFLDCFSTVVLEFLNNYPTINEENINGLSNLGQPILYHYLILFRQNLTLKQSIEKYLLARRQIEIIQFFEGHDNLEQNINKAIVPKDEYYMKLIQNEKDYFDIDLIKKVEQTYNTNPNFFINAFTKENYDKATEIMKNKLNEEKDEKYYAKKAASVLFDSLITNKFINFMTTLIQKGASVNTFAINTTYLSEQIYSEDKVLILKYENFINNYRPYIPMTIAENVKIGEKIQADYYEASQKYTTAKNLSQNIKQDLQKRINNATKNGLLQLIADCSSVDILKFLLSQGIDVNQTTQTNQTVLISMTQYAQNNEQLQILPIIFNRFSSCFKEIDAYNLDKNATDIEGSNAFLLAFKNNNIKVATYLLDQGFNINAINNQKQNALIIAALRNNYDQVEMLLERNAFPFAQDKKGRTALHYVVNNSSQTIDASFDMESLLISYGADVNIQDKLGRTPLHYAFVKIGQGSNINTPLDPIETVSSLCTVQSANPSIQDKYGKNVLHYAAQRAATISTMYLEKKGVDLHQKDIFEYAIMLIKEGSDVNQLVHQETKEIYDEFKKQQRKENIIQTEDDEEQSEDSYFKNRPIQQNGLFGQQYSIFGTNYGQQPQQPTSNAKTQSETMFKLAVDQQQLGLSYLILDNGFDLMTAMEDSLKKLKFQLVLTLLQKVSDNQVVQKTNERNQNLFHIFAQNAACLNVVAQNKILSRIYKQFKRRDIDINLKDEFQRLPLHYAAESGAFALIKEMINEKDMELDAIDQFGMTPLLLSIRNKQVFSDVSSNNSNYLETFRVLATSNNVNFDLLYTDPTYEQEEQELSRDLIMTGHQNYKLTPFLHILRSLSKLSDAQKSAWLTLFFSPPLSINIFTQKDNLSRDAITLLVLENDLIILDFVFKTWESLLSSPFLQQKTNLPTTSTSSVFKTLQSRNKYEENKDYKGRSVIHYAVQAHNKFGTYDNLQLFDYLHNKGYAIDEPDNDGKRPIDYISQYKKYSKIYKRMVKLGVKDKIEDDQNQKNQGQDLTHYLVGDVEMIDTSDIGGNIEIKYEKDAEEFTSQNKNISVQQIAQEKIKPDPILGSDHFEVQYENEEDINSAYEANLIRIDIKKYGYSAYLFYKIQLLKDPVKNIFVLLTKWGQIGESGMCQKTPFVKIEEAIEEYKKVFKQKTSNNWDQRQDFVLPKAKNKYIMFKIQRPDKCYKDLLKPFSYVKSYPSNLPVSIQVFMKQLTNIGMYNEILKINNIESSQLNLTYISKDNLEKANSILNDLQDCLNNKMSYHHEGYEDNQKEILQLSSEFFQLIPFLEFQGTIPRPINAQTLLSYKNKIYDLLTLQQASNILLGAKMRQQEISPLDYVYHALKTKIQKVVENDSDFMIIQKYIKETGQASLIQNKVNALYRISRQGDEDNYIKYGLNKDPQRLLLFHGTQQQNLLGILNCGFKVSPMGIAQNGQAFGSGIYFADQFDKSINYATPHNFNNVKLEEDEELSLFNDSDLEEINLMPKRYMFICEVALGKLVKLEQGNRQQQYYWQQYQDYFAIGTQKQLKEILNDLKKPESDDENDQDDDDHLMQQNQVMQSDYENDESENENDAPYQSEEEKRENENIGFGVIQLTVQKQGQPKQVPEPVYKDQIKDLGNGRLKLGKEADITRTLRGHKMMQIKDTKKLHRFDTLWVGGNKTPDPAFNILLQDGCIAPNGKPVQTQERVQVQKQQGFGAQGGSHVDKSEFIVKNPERVKIRYIIEIREKTVDEKNNDFGVAQQQ